MRLRCRLALPVLLPGTLTISTWAQTTSDTGVLPYLSNDAPPPGPVEIEPIDAPGYAVAQDHEGFMWFGGPSGLERYDGYDVTSAAQDGGTGRDARNSQLPVRAFNH